MRWNSWKVMTLGICGLTAVIGARAIAKQQATPPPAQQQAAPGAAAQTQTPAPEDPIKTMVGRLDLEKYKATIKGLTQFGDRRQGTDRNRAAIDWIEAQLKSYGCTNTERIKYDYQPPVPGAGRGAGGGRRGGNPGGNPVSSGGGRPRGVKARTGVNNDPNAQPDLKLRELDSQPSTPGEREEVYCTKIGTTHPDEMYIVGGHMDGIGYGEAANDDGSGTGAGDGDCAQSSVVLMFRRSDPFDLFCGTTRKPD